MKSQRISRRCYGWNGFIYTCLQRILATFKIVSLAHVFGYGGSIPSAGAGRSHNLDGVKQRWWFRHLVQLIEFFFVCCITTLQRVTGLSPVMPTEEFQNEITSP